jgi:heat shock protein HtpX
VMEMCVDNPRSGFSDLFSTHPSVANRVDRLVRFAGGHDPGPIALPPPREPQADDAGSGVSDQPPSDGPWSQSEASDKPFLPSRSPIAPPGPWGTRPDG